MNFIEFIFKLLYQFINFEAGRFSELKDKAANWRIKLMAEANNPDTKKKWYHKLVKYDEEWWFQMLLALLFLFAFKWVRAWLMSDPSQSDADDQGEDGEDDVYEQKKEAAKFSFGPSKF